MPLTIHRSRNQFQVAVSVSRIQPWLCLPFGNKEFFWQYELEVSSRVFWLLPQNCHSSASQIVRKETRLCLRGFEIDARKLDDIRQSSKALRPVIVICLRTLIQRCVTGSSHLCSNHYSSFHATFTGKNILIIIHRFMLHLQAKIRGS
jgi:hypothetical protein